MVDDAEISEMNAEKESTSRKYLLSQPQPSTNQQVENYYISLRCCFRGLSC